MTNIGVLASGSGTNLQALLDADLAPGQIVVVLSNNPKALALERAKKSCVATEVIDHRTFSSRAEFDAKLIETLHQHQVELVVFAGFMRVVTSTFLNAFPDRVLNIHPSLLPAFAGVDAQRQAIEAGVKISGCTVHLVDSGVDTGPILAQAAVSVLPQDDRDHLAQRILQQEHRLFPKVVRAVARGQIQRDGQKAWLTDASINED